MEPTHIQLVLNVVAITGVTSVAGYCYLLKKDKRELAADKSDSHGDAPKSEPAQAATAAANSMDQDIRTFAAGRRSQWVEGLASSVPKR